MTLSHEPMLGLSQLHLLDQPVIPAHIQQGAHFNQGLGSDLIRRQSTKESSKDSVMQSVHLLSSPSTQHGPATVYAPVQNCKLVNKCDADA